MADFKAGDRVRCSPLRIEYLFLGTHETLYPDALRKRGDRAWIQLVENGSVYVTNIKNLELVSND